MCSGLSKMRSWHILRVSIFLHVINEEKNYAASFLSRLSPELLLLPM